MLDTESRSTAPLPGADPNRVAQEFRDRVLPCGVDAINRLEAAVVEKLAAVRALELAAPGSFERAFHSAVEGVVTTRPHRARILSETPPEDVREVLRAARSGTLGSAHLLEVADRIRGAPADVRVDLASELLHAAAPDRIALLARWVWNPARGTGILAAFGGPPPETYPGTQARLGEIRLTLEALGFRSPTFASVDVLLALSYAGRLGEATDRSFQGGGIERLLPGSFPLAAMVLGVRRRLVDADR